MLVEELELELESELALLDELESLELELDDEDESELELLDEESLELELELELESELELELELEDDEDDLLSKSRVTFLVFGLLPDFVTSSFWFPTVSFALVGLATVMTTFLVPFFRVTLLVPFAKDWSSFVSPSTVTFTQVRPVVLIFRVTFFLTAVLVVKVTALLVRVDSFRFSFCSVALADFELVSPVTETELESIAVDFVLWSRAIVANQMAQRMMRTTKIIKMVGKYPRSWSIRSSFEGFRLPIRVSTA